MNKKNITYLVAAVVAVLVAGGVAVGVNSSGSSSTHNAADVTFSQDMIPHHQQAVEMAGYVASRSSNPQVKALAQQIAGAQSPEISTMTGWLTSWNEPVKTDGMAGMHHSGNANGMMSASDMTMLETLSGVGFDRMWLSMMTQHHNGAIDMAKTELAQGKYPQAKTLAQSITTGQAAEVTRMQDLGKQL